MKPQDTYVRHGNVMHHISINHNPDRCKGIFNFSVSSVDYFEAKLLTNNNFVSHYS